MLDFVCFQPDREIHVTARVVVDTDAAYERGHFIKVATFIFMTVFAFAMTTIIITTERENANVRLLIDILKTKNI